jgi:hypothetical protein
LGAAISVNIQAVNEGDPLTGFWDFIIVAQSTLSGASVLLILAVVFAVAAQTGVFDTALETRIVVDFGAKRDIKIPNSSGRKEYSIEYDGEIARIEIRD